MIRAMYYAAASGTAADLLLDAFGTFKAIALLGFSWQVRLFHIIVPCDHIEEP